MPRAIVNITCPWCGGRVDGIQSLDAPRTMPCPYCRTELHVPHVGKIIHERVVREVIVPESAPDPVIPTGEGNAVGAAIALLLAFFGVVYLMVQHSRSSAPTSSPPSHYEQFKACIERCEASCGPKPDDSWSRRPDDRLYDLDGMHKSVDWSICSGNCSLSCSEH